MQRRAGRRGDIVYNIGQKDVDRAAESMAKLAEMFFAVGASSVMCGVQKLPKYAYDRSVADQIRNTSFTVHDLPLASNHIFGTTAMGTDRSRHVVDESGAVYDIDDLYVCDTGLLPSTPAANPMLPMMALVHRNVEAINQRY